MLEALAGGIDTTFQNVDSSEVSITDVDHYFEYLGGLSALVEHRSGNRNCAQCHARSRHRLPSARRAATVDPLNAIRAE